MRFRFTTILLLAQTATTSAFGQTNESSDPFRIPSTPVASCAVIDKSELITKGIGFRYDLEEDGDHIVDDRTVDAEFESSGAPLALVIVGADDVRGNGASPRFLIVQFGSTGDVSVLDMRKKNSPATESKGAASRSPVPDPTLSSPSAAARAKQFATWLWLRRCPAST
jgi:hypothetical protein